VKLQLEESIGKVKIFDGFARQCNLLDKAFACYTSYHSFRGIKVYWHFKATFILLTAWADEAILYNINIAKNTAYKVPIPRTNLLKSMARSC